MNNNETDLSPKIHKFICECCEYITSNKRDYNKHNLTLKHKNNEHETNLKQNSPENPQKSPKLKCNCGQIYNSRTSLWRHKQKCDTNNVINESKSNSEELTINSEEFKITPETIVNILKQNSELQQMLIEQNKTIIELSKNNQITNNITNSNNKAFNLNFFLNETCKNAMNITEFVDSIQLQLSDFENVGDIGFVNGISNIIIKNLKALDVTKRPVHCTDQKRETIYIKDENKWEKEDEKNQKLRKVIKKVVSKNHRLILKFREVYPDYNKYSSPTSTRYDKIIIEAMGGLGNNDLEKEDKIIRNIVKNIVIDK